MEKRNKIYAEFLNSTAKDADKKVITKKFNKAFRNIKFTYYEEVFNKEFLNNLFVRKKIA